LILGSINVYKYGLCTGSDERGGLFTSKTTDWKGMKVNFNKRAKKDQNYEKGQIKE
jgi:hypothetical protein